jgi:hypothetical protein
MGQERLNWGNDHTRCQAAVYHREQLRYTGRGTSGFERYYVTARCRRKAIKNGWCWQHQEKEGAG